MLRLLLYVPNNVTERTAIEIVIIVKIKPFCSPGNTSLSEKSRTEKCELLQEDDSDG